MIDIWSSPFTLRVKTAFTWNRSNESIHLSPGRYMFGIKANTKCINSIYISVKADTFIEKLNLYEKDIIMPMSGGELDVLYDRAVSITCMLPIFEETDLYFYVYSHEINIDIKWEIWAKKISNNIQI